MAEVTDDQVRKAVEEEAEEDPEFLASLTEGLSSQRDVRERAARRLDVDEALLKPFKKTIKAVMTDLWTAPDAEPEALEKVVKKPAKKRSPRPKKDKPQPKKPPAKAEDAPESLKRRTSTQATTPSTNDAVQKMDSSAAAAVQKLGGGYMAVTWRSHGGSWSAKAGWRDGCSSVRHASRHSCVTGRGAGREERSKVGRRARASAGRTGPRGLRARRGGSIRRRTTGW